MSLYIINIFISQNFQFRYYEFDTGYCAEGSDQSDYSSSDMKSYMQIRKWGPQLDSLQEGKVGKKP